MQNVKDQSVQSTYYASADVFASRKLPIIQSNAIQVQLTRYLLSLSSSQATDISKYFLVIERVGKKSLRN